MPLCPKAPIKFFKSTFFFNFINKPLLFIIFNSLTASPKDAKFLLESLPITFAEIAPPKDILSPPGIE